MQLRRILTVFILIAMALFITSCDMTPQANAQAQNRTAQEEQLQVEKNQSGLNEVQPPPRVTWSLERDNLTRRFKLMNDRGVIMYMYVFVPCVREPIGYYQVNKVSSVNSQLTNPAQVMLTDVYDTGEWAGRTAHVIPSPAEDGSYGTNGDAIFGFTPEEVYIEHNMLYMCATAPLNFTTEVTNLGNINVKTLESLKALMDRLDRN